MSFHFKRTKLNLIFFDFRLRRVQPRNNFIYISQSAFSRRFLDEKSTDPYPNSSNPINTMKAILTSDGSIKIILCADKTENSETIKENFLSKEKPSIKEATKP